MPRSRRVLVTAAALLSVTFFATASSWVAHAADAPSMVVAREPIEATAEAGSGPSAAKARSLALTPGMGLLGMSALQADTAGLTLELSDGVRRWPARYRWDGLAEGAGFTREGRLTPLGLMVGLLLFLLLARTTLRFLGRVLAIR